MTCIEWINSLKDDARIQTTMQESSVADDQNHGLEVLIFCDGVERGNIMGIGCVAYNRDGVILTTISKWVLGDSPVFFEIFAIEVALKITL